MCLGVAGFSLVFPFMIGCLETAIKLVCNRGSNNLTMLVWYSSSIRKNKQWSN